MKRRFLRWWYGQLYNYCFEHQCDKEFAWPYECFRCWRAKFDRREQQVLKILQERENTLKRIARL